tara:strand:+ start:1162 stop:1326 length:165 start_codon:yes stop_codon:yes gene_type:complete
MRIILEITVVNTIVITNVIGYDKGISPQENFIASGVSPLESNLGGFFIYTCVRL